MLPHEALYLAEMAWGPLGITPFSSGCLWMLPLLTSHRAGLWGTDSCMLFLFDVDLSEDYPHFPGSVEKQARTGCF